MIESRICRIVAALVIAVASIMSVIPEVAHAAADGGRKVVKGEKYMPTIWVDPDGCEHWVMDDGAEGYMTPHVTRDGKPVCRTINLCGTMPTDQFFATDSYRISAAGKQRLREFFKSANARGFIIKGHTDSRASDAYNLRLSKNRANAVAQVAKSVGARVYEVQGLGERQPRVPNTSPENMAKNRRVEIMCVK